MYGLLAHLTLRFVLRIRKGGLKLSVKDCMAVSFSKLMDSDQQSMLCSHIPLLVTDGSDGMP